MWVTGEITGSPEENLEWKIDSFSSLLNCGDYNSPPFDFAGETWNLSMRKCWKHLSQGNEDCYTLFRLVKFEDGGSPIRVEYTFSIKTQGGSEYKVTRNIEEFRRKWSGEIHIPLEYHRLPELVLDNCITVLCRLRRIHPTTKRDAGGSGCANFCYCEKPFDAGSISSHQKRCLDKPIKCPECSDVVLLRNWYDHECQNGSADAEDNKSGSTLPKTRILQDLKQLFLSQEDCDVVIRVKDREFKAHSVILKARSPVLASALRTDMKEKATGIVEIVDLDPSAFSNLLCFLYCEEVDSLSEGNVLDLYTVADKYDVPDLKRMCVEFMRENLCVETFCDVMRLALLHSETKLINFCTDFFIKNATRIIATVQWLTFNAENPTQSNELFLKFARSVDAKSCKRIKLSDD